MQRATFDVTERFCRVTGADSKGDKLLRSCFDQLCRLFDGSGKRHLLGLITWSAGITTMVASGSSRCSSKAASPMQGAVSRLHGSPRIELAGKVGKLFLDSCYQAAGSLGREFARPVPAVSIRSTVCWIMLRVPLSVSSCFGRSARLAGQKRVPLPPAMIRACNIGYSGPEQVQG